MEHGQNDLTMVDVMSHVVMVHSGREDSATVQLQKMVASFVEVEISQLRLAKQKLNVPVSNYYIRIMSKLNTRPCNRQFGWLSQVFTAVLL